MSPTGTIRESTCIAAGNGDTQWTTAQRFDSKVELRICVRQPAVRASGAFKAEYLLWTAAALALVGMVIFLPSASDAKDYVAALSNFSGYLEGSATYSLAYSPLFLIPVLAGFLLLPFWLTVVLYVVAYLSGWLTQLWAGLQCATDGERKMLRYVMPVLMFFPGFLVCDVFTAGNIAYILYGLILAAAVPGWKRNQWRWFYVAVLAAACAKVPLLTMLAIPILSGRRQSLPAVGAGVIGVSLYSLQGWLWPGPFRTYANSIQAMAHSQRDFGCSVVGNLAHVLWGLHLPYESLCVVLYGVYAVALFAYLGKLSMLYWKQRICFESWTPVMLIGVILLSPRIQAYDVAAVTLPMAIVVWRALHGPDGKLRKRWAFAAGIALLGLNLAVESVEVVMALSGRGSYYWRSAEMLVLLVVFHVGVRGLMREAGEERISLFDMREFYAPKVLQGVQES
jgi:hypothetical protein